MPISATISPWPPAQVTSVGIPGLKGADGDITWQGEWSSLTTYTINQAVQYDGQSYVALQGGTDKNPSSQTSYWSLMTAKGASGADGTSATVSIGTVTTVATGNSATVTNSGTSSAATFDFNIPKGSRGEPGNLTWQGAWNSGVTYYKLDVVYYQGGSYTSLNTNINVVPTVTTTWNVLALAGAAGGTINGMADTDLSSTISDAAIILYNSTSEKWVDSNVFGTNSSALQLDGGTF
jgi:hypothetical protein